jgi:hypothetical protein
VKCKNRPRRANERQTMTDKEGTLPMMASGRWAIYRPGRLPVEITSGELRDLSSDVAQPDDTKAFASQV